MAKREIRMEEVEGKLIKSKIHTIVVDLSDNSIVFKLDGQRSTRQEV